VGFCFLFVSIPLQAQVKPSVDVRLTHQKVLVGLDNQETFEPAETAKPGEIIQYTAIYTNQSTSVVRNLRATLPIPVGLSYVENSAKPATVKATVDGEHFDTVPLKRKIKNSDGKEVEEMVPVAEYRKLQWNIRELLAGESVAVSARARVNRATEPSSKP